MKTIPHCIECGKPISWGVHVFSQRIYGHSLCLKDQCEIAESGATGEAVDLYLALKSRKFPLVLDYFDGHKHIDMALPGRLYIEVNDPYLLTSHQAMNELTNSVYSLEKKIPTIMISHTMLENPKTFDHVVNELSKACSIMLKPVENHSFALTPPLTLAQLQ
ncbi:MAG TPA: hypothetical protein VGH64_17395 [Puia sp.]|jgi:hypothetical protein